MAVWVGFGARTGCLARAALAGCGGGTISAGRHIRYEKETPLNNLWLSMLDRMEAPTDKLGDSTGRLLELAG